MGDSLFFIVLSRIYKLIVSVEGALFFVVRRISPMRPQPLFKVQYACKFPAALCKSPPCNCRGLYLFFCREFMSQLRVCLALSSSVWLKTRHGRGTVLYLSENRADFWATGTDVTSLTHERYLQRLLRKSTIMPLSTHRY